MESLALSWDEEAPFAVDLSGRPMTAKRVSRIVSKIGAKAAVIANGEGKPASAHDFRRSFGTRWAKRGMPAVLQQLMRHVSLKTSLTYYIALDTDELADEFGEAHRGADSGPVRNTCGNTCGNIEGNGRQEAETGPAESSTEPDGSFSLTGGGHGTRTDDVSPFPVKGLREPETESGTFSGTPDADSALIDPDLRAIVEAWPKLPEETRRHLLGMVRVAERHGQRPAKDQCENDVDP